MNKFRAVSNACLSMLAMVIVVGAAVSGPTSVRADDAVQTENAQPGHQVSTASNGESDASSSAASTSAKGTSLGDQSTAKGSRRVDAQASVPSSTKAAATKSAGSDAATVAATPATETEITGRYATILLKGYTFWQSLAWNKSGNMSTQYYQQTLSVVAAATSEDGTQYYQLATDTGRVLGYINAKAVSVTDQPGGAAFPSEAYATITTTGNYSIWSNLDFTAKTAMSKTVFHNTFRVTAIYHHSNGSTYYELSRDGQTFGYINSEAATFAKTSGGFPINMSKFATTTINAHYTIWKNFEWTAKLGTTQPDAHKTYQVRRVYYHANGSAYYSLYRSGVWCGYLNSDAVTLADNGRGVGIALNRYVSVMTKKFPIWTSTALTKSAATSTTYYHKTLYVPKAFYAESGETYYQLANESGKTIGLVNAKSVGLADGEQGKHFLDSRKVGVKTTYTIWSTFGWQRAATQATNYVGQTLVIKGYYNHINGSRYDSLYTKAGKWIGYVNDKGVKPLGWQSTGGQVRFFDGSKWAYTKTFTVQYYSQLDPRWAGKSYGYYNFGATGCGMASIAMILSGYGKNVTPVTAANYAYKYGHFDRKDAGSWESDLTDVASHFGLNYKVMKSASELTSYLKKGYPATVCLDLGGGVRHIVVLHGYLNGKTTVSDPYNRRLYTGQRKISEIWCLLSWRAVNVNRGKSAAVVYLP